MEFLHFREPVSAWSHALGLLLALPATLILLRRARGDRTKQVGFLVFGLTLAACYAASALFHGVRASPDWLHWYNTADHAGIYLLIAGTITPVALILLEGRWRWGILALTWAFAAAGITLCLTVRGLPLAVSTALYLMMGWSVLACYIELTRVLPPGGMRLPVLGGILYSAGALLNVLHWPVLWPGVVGPHEVFHVFVLGGSLCHFLFVLNVVAPYRRPAVVALPDAALQPAALPAR